jgi:outer membrane protein assembly factor BamB
MLLLALLAGALSACSGGGNNTTTVTAAWEKFRHDAGNTGAALGVVGANTGVVKWSVPGDLNHSSITASPAIGLNGVVYIATEGGTVAAFNTTDGTPRWSIDSCTCAGESRSLGRLLASPAVYSFNGHTSVFVGSSPDDGSGALFAFDVDDTAAVLAPTCTVCFLPASTDVGATAPISVAFTSSPSFETNAFTFAVSGIFAAAAVTALRDGTTAEVGKIYALNADGTTRWQFPPVGGTDIGPVTSSPALSASGAVYFTAADAQPTPDRQLILYALANDGSPQWKFALEPFADAGGPFTSSPLVANAVYAATARGQVVALNADRGDLRWRSPAAPNDAFVGSLAIGDQFDITPTPTPIPTAAPPGPPGATQTPTETPVRPATALFGITKSGTVVVIDTGTGAPIGPTGPLPTPIAVPVISSPALSADFFLVFGTEDGKLYALNTLTLEPPSTPTPGGPTPGANWPITLGTGMPILSSPAIDSDGTIFVGSSDGNLYAIGTPP